MDRERVGERHRQSCWSEQQTELFPGRLSPICILVLWFNDFCCEWNYKIAVASLSIHQFSIFLRNSLLVSSDFWHDGNFIFDEIWPKSIFGEFWKIYQKFKFFFGNNLKLKSYDYDISPLIPHLAKFSFSSYGPKCWQPISRKACGMKLFFLKINTKVFYKLIV